MIRAVSRPPVFYISVQEHLNLPLEEGGKKLTVGADAYIGPFENVANFPKNAYFVTFPIGAMWASPPTITNAGLF